jgi:septal ring factor EnvC (AmiA/AmiB activator)
MMTTCSDTHEEIVHTGDCPACSLLAQLTEMTNERDEALLKLEKAEAQIESLQQEIVLFKDQADGLSRLLEEKDRQLASLNKVVVELKGELASLDAENDRLTHQ